MEQSVINNATPWTLPPFDEETITETKKLIAENGENLVDSFYKSLEFGTGGLRGIMGVGTNKINKYTIGLATQGLANYLKKAGKAPLSVAIALDCRNNSDYFAQVAADVLSANGIQVYVYESLRATPQLSYTIRQLNCSAGIVITASHNPKEYNGYKVYWNDGGQLVPPHDKNVIDEVNKIKSVSDVKFEPNVELVNLLGHEMDEKYLNTLNQLLSDDVDKNTKVVYTSIHGTGIVSIPKLLAKKGYKNVYVVEEQATPDGNFPTVVSPNPEEKAALDLALEKGKEVDADIILGTDPDADRVGIAVKNLEGNFELLNGNQTASVLFYYMMQKANLNEHPYFVCKTIVTSELITEVANHFKIPIYNTLTGFKYIAEVIKEKEGKEKFLCGGEESYGYLIGDDVRDKDAVISAAMLVEVAAWAKQNGKSFYELLLEVYQTIGFYREALVSLTKKGKKGLDEIQDMMKNYRATPLKLLGGFKVVKIHDYQTSKTTLVAENKEVEISLPKSNVIQFLLEDGSLVTARPSGTEPKIKFYFSVKGNLNSKASFNQDWEALGQKIESFKADLIS
jgi:phosphoglucomutase